MQRECIRPPPAAGRGAPLTEAECAQTRRRHPDVCDRSGAPLRAAGTLSTTRSVASGLRKSTVAMGRCIHTPHPIVDTMVRWAADTPARAVAPGAGSGRFQWSSTRRTPSRRLFFGMRAACWRTALDWIAFPHSTTPSSGPGSLVHQERLGGRIGQSRVQDLRNVRARPLRAGELLFRDPCPRWCREAVVHAVPVGSGGTRKNDKQHSFGE